MSPQTSAGTRTRPSGSFCWIDLKSRFPEETFTFFTEVLDWKFRRDVQGWRPKTLISAGDWDIASLSDVSNPVYPPDISAHIAFYLAVEDIEATIRSAGEAGAEIVVEPFEAGDEGRIATLLDPSGGAVSLWQRPRDIGWVHTGSISGAPLRLRFRGGATVRIEAFYRNILGLTDPAASFEDVANDSQEPAWSLAVSVESVEHVRRQVAARGGSWTPLPGPPGQRAALTTRDGIGVEVEQMASKAGA